MTTSSNAILAAADNEYLRRRLVAIAAQMGIGNPEVWVDARVHELASAPVDETGDNSVASVFEYAKIVRDQALAKIPADPGANPAAVTDDYMRYAVNHLRTAEGTRE